MFSALCMRKTDRRKLYPFSEASWTAEGEALKEKCKDIPLKLASTASKLSPEDAKELYRILYQLLDEE